VIGRAVSFVDIGERMRLEEQLEEAKRISGLGRLAASIAHEINNVLMGILPFAEIVARSAEPAHRTAAEQIRRSVQRGRGVTQEILRFARQEKPDRQLFEGGAWLRATAAELHQIAGPRLAVETPDQPFYLDADPAQLAQVLINLVMNANDAVDPSSGRITVAVAPRDEGSLFPFGALPERGHRWIWFRVIDDGAGMDGETLQHLLEPFFTKKRGGTGLGLPIAYRIVAAHGGLFFVESAEGQGSTFHIFLPEAPRPAAPLPPDPAPRAALSGEVLLVEDDETVAAGLALMLADAGMTCRVVGTGLEALHALELSLPAVVILDIGLPDIDGAQICEEAIRRHPRVPIVISTGHADASRLGTCLENPHVRFLRKPYEFEQLLEVMKEAIAGGR
jgi:nitrogen-specific signal transduction histidine kinase/CheY-like chemotaxis protein